MCFAAAWPRVRFPLGVYMWLWIPRRVQKRLTARSTEPAASSPVRPGLSTCARTPENTFVALLAAYVTKR
eukprot:9267513-Lingulodinium_polyedra.AAC.1